MQESFDIFKKSCEKVINMGVMERLFHDFDFFSIEDRDMFSTRAINLKMKRNQPSIAKAKTDIFGDVEYEFDSDLSDVDSDASELNDQKTDMT